MPTLTKFFIYPYAVSDSARALNEAINGLLIRHKGSQYRYKPHHTVINWGSYGCPAVLEGVPVLNAFDSVRVASSKIATFEALAAAGVPHVAYTTSNQTARNWQARVVGRDLDRGAQGKGTHVYQKGEEIGQHKFYTRYYKKEREFRVHVLKGKVIFVQEKLKKRGVENVDPYIRSHGRGWCFGFKHFDGKPVPELVEGVARNAVRSLALDFGAVDLGWNSKDGAVVFEVNTAPGIENTSLQAYANAFMEI